MKKIYTFTIEGEDYYSSSFRSNLRLIAYLLYESIRDYDDYQVEDGMPLVSSRNIVYNKIHEDKCGSGYFFDSDMYKGNGYVDYEPFIIGNNSFGFTINDELIDEDNIKKLLTYVLNLLNLNYKVTIGSVCYQSKSVEDEKNRLNAIKLSFEKLGYKINKKMDFAMRFAKPNVRNKKKYNVYGR